MGTTDDEALRVIASLKHQLAELEGLLTREPREEKWWLPFHEVKDAKRCPVCSILRSPLAPGKMCEPCLENLLAEQLKR